MYLLNIEVSQDSMYICRGNRYGGQERHLIARPIELINLAESDSVNAELIIIEDSSIIGIFEGKINMSDVIRKATSHEEDEFWRVRGNSEKLESYESIIDSITSAFDKGYSSANSESIQATKKIIDGLGMLKGFSTEKEYGQGNKRVVKIDGNRFKIEVTKL